jgi:hypothetical protein
MFSPFLFLLAQQVETCESKLVALQGQVTNLTHGITAKERDIASHIQSISNLHDKNCQLNNEVIHSLIISLRARSPSYGRGGLTNLDTKG